MTSGNDAAISWIRRRSNSSLRAKQKTLTYADYALYQALSGVLAIQNMLEMIDMAIASDTVSICKHSLAMTSMGTF